MAVRTPYGRRRPSGGKIFAAIIGFVVFIIAMAIYHAFVFKTLFNWFVAPHFDVQPIGWAMAFGLSTMISLFTARTPSTDDDGGGLSAAFAIGFAAPTISLLIGWFAQASL